MKDVFYSIDGNVVLKIVKTNSLNEVELQNLASKLELAPKILKYYFKDDLLHIYMERVKGICLSDLKNINDNIWNQIRKIISVLYSNQIEYSDVTPYNFILDDNGKVWIIDFGHSRKINGEVNWYVSEFLDGENFWNPDFE